MKKGEFALIWAVICWGMSFIWTKSALSAMSVFSIIFIRFSLASLILFAAGTILKKNLRAGKGLLRLLLLSFFQPVAYFVSETNALKYISTQKASLIASTIPLFYAIFTSIVQKKLPEKITVISIIMSVTGIGFLLGKDLIGGTDNSAVTGTVFMFSAVVSAVFYITLTGHLAKKIDTYTITFYQMLLGSLMLLPFFLADIFFNGMPDFSPEASYGLLMLTVFSTVTAFLCYNFSIARTSPARSALFLNAVPVVTIIAAFILRNETLGLSETAGSVMIIASLYLVNLKKRTAQ